MNLSKEQLKQFDEEGYLFFPSLFSKEETKVLQDEVPHLYERREEYNVREKNAKSLRTK